jgi:hypothetical protein
MAVATEERCDFVPRSATPTDRVLVTDPVTMGLIPDSWSAVGLTGAVAAGEGRAALDLPERGVDMSESNLSEHPVAAFGGFLASPIAGGVASLVFATEKCTELACTQELNQEAAFAVTAVGWLCTGIVLLAQGDDNMIAWLLFCIAAGAGLGWLLAPGGNRGTSDISHPPARARPAAATQGP